MPSISLPVALAATAAAGVAGAAISSGAANKAGNIAKTTAADSNALQKEIYDKNAATLSPFITQGTENSGRLNALLATNPYDFTADKFTADPGYQFRLQQGLNSVTQSKAVGGLLKSGSALKALNDYAQGGASQEYGNAYNRYEQSTGNYVNALQNQQGVGLSAAGAQAGVSTGYANAVGANNNAAANTVGNAALASANTINNTIGQGINALSYGVGNGGFGAQRGSSYTMSNNQNGVTQI